MQDFELFEYVVVGASLLATAMIGYYTSSSSKVSDDYMLGGRRIKTLPTAMSLAASVISGSVVVSIGQESYLFGMPLFLFTIIPVLTIPIYVRVYLPVIYNIRSVSAFEFFQRRFNKYVRRVVSVIYILDTIQHTAISQYIPAVTFSQACGYSPFTVACVFSVFCMGYTIFGGLKSVTWADSCQAVIMAICSLMVLTIGLYKTGGPFEVYKKLSEGYRSQIFDFDWNPSLRYSVWVQFIANFLLYASTEFLNPTQHQRFVATPSFQVATKAAYLNSAFTIPYVVLSISTGLIAYAYFAGCDPVLAKQGIKSHTTIMPYFVNQVADGFPGLKGLFQAGVIAAGMSTTTSNWNSLSCTVYDDLIKPFLSRESNEKHFRKILMALTTLICLSSTLVVYLLQDLSSQLLGLSMTMSAVTRGSSYVLFHAGMFLPWVNSKGAIMGGLSSAVITLYIVSTAGMAIKRKDVIYEPKLLTTADCIINGTRAAALNMTLTMGTATEGLVTVVKKDVKWLASLSIYYYPIPGVLIGLIVSLVVSFLTGGNDLEAVDRKMIVPQMRWALPKEKFVDEVELEKNGKFSDTYEGTSIDGYVVVNQNDTPISKHKFRNQETSK